MKAGFRLAMVWVWAVSGAWAQIPAPAPAPAPENLTRNPGFEDRQAGAIHLPAQWDVFSFSEKVMVSLSDATKRSGARALRIGASGLKGAHAGVVQVREVDRKARYVFRAHALDDALAGLGGGAEFLLCIEWLDADGTEVDRSESRALAGALSRTNWKELEVMAHPPPKAARGKFVLLLREPKQPGRGGVLVDDVEIHER
jgi:hypothetical protein